MRKVAEILFSNEKDDKWKKGIRAASIVFKKDIAAQRKSAKKKKKKKCGWNGGSPIWLLTRS